MWQYEGRSPALTCGHTFTETNLLSSSHACGRDHPCWPKGISLSRVKGHKEDTILAWLRDAAEHAAALEAELLARYRIERGQLDSLWAYVGNKKGYPETAESGQFWRATLWTPACVWLGESPNSQSAGV
jgi:hypothetical protein